jgi:aquaporin Z
MRRRARWPEYAAEAAALGIFMISASLFTALLEHHRSAAVTLIPDPIVRRVLMGAAMGLTAAAIIYSPLGARSGAHMNPAVSLAFVRLGKLPAGDAVGYVLAQFIGAFGGMLAAHALLGSRLGEPAVHYVQTRPGPAGPMVALLAELLISFATLSVVLRVAAARPPVARLAGAAAGVLVMLNITLEAPLSGMSMNPARSLGPALLAGRFDTLWVYFVAPPLGMALAAQLFRSRDRAAPCPRLNHTPDRPCIFCGNETAICTTT